MHAIRVRDEQDYRKRRLLVLERICAAGRRHAILAHMARTILLIFFFYVLFVNQDEANAKKAVMVFIHGGAFNHGSSALDRFSPDYLLDENVIVVTFNYRLNVFGKRH